MENIIEPNDSFDFTNLTLSQPIGIQGGAYFTKIEYKSKPLYIQTTKSLTRQGFVKTGKKYYCDLMFDNNSSQLIHWFENLEETCIKRIYEKSDTWFQNALEMSDVESAFNSIIRVYKSGKYYLVRTNAKSSTLTNEPVVKIYNENEIPLRQEDIHSDTNIISILEIQGIKFTSRNFQIEIELKQMMILDNEPIFENCLIKTSKKNIVLNNETKGIDEKTEISTLTNSNIENNNLETNIEDDLFASPSLLSDNKNENENENLTNEMFDNSSTNIGNTNSLPEESLDLIIEELENEDLKEIDLNISLENDNKKLDDSFILKKPNQVYFELYKNARNKAKQAKKSLILAFLEAKNIKKTYMLENLNENSDSDLDAEIEEVSESDLDSF